MTMKGREEKDVYSSLMIEYGAKINSVYLGIVMGDMENSKKKYNQFQRFVRKNSAYFGKPHEKELVGIKKLLDDKFDGIDGGRK